MKMTYVKPETLAVAVMHFESLLLSASESPREIGGGVTEGSDGLPTTTGETGEGIDPFGGHGQGGSTSTGGSSGNRSKGGLWDDWDDEE